MITDAVLADYILALYHDFISFTHVEETSGVFWGYIQDTNYDIFITRGSVNAEDWFRDISSETASALPKYEQLGLIPKGFSLGLIDTKIAMAKYCRDNKMKIFTGHSLGAAHAVELAAMFQSVDRCVAKIMVCGCPRPGTDKLCEILKDVEIHNYRNHNDPVPNVPIPFPLVLPWCDIAPRIMLEEPGTEPDPWILLKDHHMELYKQGIAKLNS